MRVPRRATQVLLGLAIVLSAAGLAGCADDELETIEAVLVAPPAVPPHEDRSAAHVVVNLEAVEEVREIAPGVEYEVWSFNSTVPGPMIRVRVGDTVEVRLKNLSTNSDLHNIDLHAVNGPGGGAVATNVAPGEEKAFTFEAKAAGLFVYHCAAGIVADHISNGMFGGILVDGGGASQDIDQEYYVGQHEFYLTDDEGSDGIPTLDSTKLLAEEPTYVVFNGNTEGLKGDNVLEAETGETVRIYVANGGPNFISSFHVIGEIFDRVYEYGSLENLPIEGLQTVLVPPGGSAITDFFLDVPGDYLLVDHALSRVSKGGLGILRVTGDADPSVFNPLGEATSDMGHGEATEEPSEEATEEPTEDGNAEPTAEPTEGNGEGGNTISLQMSDNFFVPEEITVSAGTTVTFELENIGDLPHNMNIAESGSYDDGVVSQPDLITAGNRGELIWDVPDEPGEYDFRCDIHPVEMVGVITVE